VAEFVLKRDLARERDEREEFKRRHDGWIAFVTAFIAQRGESDPPTTKRDYEERKRIDKGGKPKEPTPEEWRDAEESRRAWSRLRRDYYESAMDPHHWETTMRFPDHLFPETDRPAIKTATELRHGDADVKQEVRERHKRLLASVMAAAEAEPGG
jgi:hypothetical protein